MWPFKRTGKGGYQLVGERVEEEDALDLDDFLGTSRPAGNQGRLCSITPKASLLAGTILLILVFLTGILGFGVIDLIPNGNTRNTYSAPGINSSCPLRREWRSLTTSEQHHYITSVHCLLSQPSLLHHDPGADSSLYEDFPTIHAHVGYKSHNSAQFLPWHRYFLHIYEKALRESCGFTGEGLVYWDWTLDAAALESSPVFDTVTGFGGNGRTDGPVTVGNHGRCVVDGPFADVVPKFYDVKYQPHCLSRGFRTDNGAHGHMDGRAVTAEAIDEVLNIDSYEDFVARLESQIHDTIPFGIGGDFETFTAPYDPLFYLHHVQLDRLWWLWQQRDPEGRTMLYEGHKARHSIEMASLDDTVEMKGLAEDVLVRDVMDTEGARNGDGMLCYRF